MPTESHDHGHMAAMLTELNRVHHKAAGQGKAVLFAAFACGIIVMGAGVTMTPAPRTVKLSPSPSLQAAQTVTPQPQARGQQSSSSDDFLAILDLSAPLSPARSVINQPVPPSADAGPALEPDLDGDLAIMPKAPKTLVRIPSAPSDSPAGQGGGQPGQV